MLIFLHCQREYLPIPNNCRHLVQKLTSAIQRCYNPRATGFQNYGGRGITVHKEWRDDRDSFLHYAQTLEGWDNLEFDMDRIDNNGNYEPGNIRFCSRLENCKNKRTITALEKEIYMLKKEIAHLRSMV